MNKDLVAIFEYLEREKGIKREVVIAAIEESLRTAAQKSIKGSANVTVHIRPKTGEIVVYSEKEIVEEVELPSMEISLEEARELDPECELGQFIDVQVFPEDLGRIAAQKARMIIAGKLRSAERDVIYEEYRHRINDLVSGTVKKFVKGSSMIVDLGKVEAILPSRYYPRSERYQVGDRVLALLYEVRDTESGGAEVVLSRCHDEFVKQLLINEIPEIEEGVVRIHQIVREPGYRTKLTVSSDDPKVDPIGACIGMRGSRVKNVVSELNEKIDIIPYKSDPVELLQASLDPVEIKKISVDKEARTMSLVIGDEEYPRVIGKGGVNLKLTSRLVGFTLDVKRTSEYHKMMALQQIQFSEEKKNLDLEKTLEGISGVNKFVFDTLFEYGYTTLGSFQGKTPDDLASIPGITLETAYSVLENIRKQGISGLGQKP